MAPSFLIIGATGNTGVGVVHTLSSLLEIRAFFSSYNIIALTRNASGKAAQELAKLHRVQVIEKNWIYISAEWLREHQIQRLFIASHIGPSHFTDESLILTYAKEAEVEYVVRISTTASYISPDTSVFHGRNHWAVETMLSQPEFNSMKWSSLRPNGLTSLIVGILQGWLKISRETSKQSPLGIVFDGDAPVAMADP